MDLSEIRKQIDEIDDSIVRLFCERMHLSAQVADYKMAHQLPIHVPEREQQILDSLTQKAGPELGRYVCDLYQAIFVISRDYQEKHMYRAATELTEVIP